MTKFGSDRIERKKFWDRMRLYGYVSSGFILLVALAYIFCVSNIFRITSVTIESPIEVDEKTILDAVHAQVRSQSGMLGSDSYFSWDTDYDYSAPNVSSIQIEKSWLGKSVKLIVEPRQRFFVWCQQNTSSAYDSARCFWIDQSGLIFEPAPETEGQLVQAIYDDADDQVFTLGGQILDTGEFTVATKIFKSEILKNIGIRAIKVVRSLQEIQLTTTGGVKLLFSLRFNPEATALPALLKFMENPGLSKLEYVNLTVENRAFVKYK
jgi:hypothetical protein